MDSGFDLDFIGTNFEDYLAGSYSPFVDNGDFENAWVNLGISAISYSPTATVNATRYDSGV